MDQEEEEKTMRKKKGPISRVHPRNPQYKAMARENEIGGKEKINRKSKYPTSVPKKKALRPAMPMLMPHKHAVVVSAPSQQTKQKKRLLEHDTKRTSTIAKTKRN